MISIFGHELEIIISLIPSNLFFLFILHIIESYSIFDFEVDFISFHSFQSWYIWAMCHLRHTILKRRYTLSLHIWKVQLKGWIYVFYSWIFWINVCTTAQILVTSRSGNKNIYTITKIKSKKITEIKKIVFIFYYLIFNSDEDILYNIDIRNGDSSNAHRRFFFTWRPSWWFIFCFRATYKGLYAYRILCDIIFSSYLNRWL
jgi:hypothetical protein